MAVWVVGRGVREGRHAGAGSPAALCDLRASDDLLVGLFPIGESRQGVLHLGEERPLPALSEVDSLLPSFCLARRLDAVEVIGPAVTDVSTGTGTRSAAKKISGIFAHTTVRGWWRRHRQRADALLGYLAAIAATVGAAVPGRSGVAEADAVIELKMVAAVVAGGVGTGLWPAVSLVTAGRWLSKTTMDTPFSGQCGRRLMIAMAAGQAGRPP
jgi:hypothetical protein